MNGVDDSNGAMYEHNGAPAMHDDHLLPRGIPDPPVIPGRGFGLFRRTHKQTTKPPVLEPQFSAQPCRLGGCPFPGRAGRLSGFCGDPHML